MAFAVPLNVLLAIALGSAGVLYYRCRKRVFRLPLPPGPPKHFLLGNLKDLPRQREWLAYAEISKKYNSDVISFSVLGNTIIVLNSHRSITDLVGKRALYADRPSVPMVTDERLMNLGGLASIARYGPRWRQLRKGIQLEMQESGIPNYWPAHVSAARDLMVKLLEHGDRSFYKDLQRWSASSILTATYGYHIAEDGTSDALLQAMGTLVEMFLIGVSSVKFTVNLLPALKYLPDWVPGARFKTVARQTRDLKRNAIDEPFDWVKAQMKNGNALPSFVSRSLSETELAGNESHDSANQKLLSFEDTVRYNAGLMFGAGSDTTLITMTSFIIAMQLHPDIQSRAREEILSTLDQVTQLPDPSAVMSLSYLPRVLKEVMRWMPALPTSVPHATMEQDEYDGYTIPAQSIILPNVWAATRDQEVYPNPEIFNPDRFLDPTVPYEHPFGHGRRQCPGMHFANANLLITAAYLLTVFELDKGVDEGGNVLEPRPLLKDDPEFQPDNLKCVLRPRDPKLLDELRLS